MKRRTFLATAAALPNALTATISQGQGHSQDQGQGQEKITHVDTKRGGAALKSSVVKGKSLSPTGDSPGAKAYVHYNGPTAQLTAVATGMVTLEPGARPHPPHQHPEEEFVIIGSGSGEIVVDGVTTQVEAGDIMYAAGNVLHGITNTGSTVMVFYFTKYLVAG